MGQGSLGCLTYFISLDPISTPTRLVSFAPLYRRGEHNSYQLRTCHHHAAITLFFLLEGPDLSSTKTHALCWCAALWSCIGEARDGQHNRIIKPSTHVAYSRHCDENFEFITTGNSPTRLRKKLPLFLLYR